MCTSTPSTNLIPLGFCFALIYLNSLSAMVLICTGFPLISIKTRIISFSPKPPGNSFKQWEHPILAKRLLNPQIFRVAGTSDEKHSTAAQNFKANLLRADFKRTPFHNALSSSTAGFKNSFKFLSSRSNEGTMHMTIMILIFSRVIKIHILQNMSDVCFAY